MQSDAIGCLRDEGAMKVVAKEPWRWWRTNHGDDGGRPRDATDRERLARGDGYAVGARGTLLIHMWGSVKMRADGQLVDGMSVRGRDEDEDEKIEDRGEDREGP